MKLKVKAHTEETILSSHHWQNCSCGKTIMRCRCLSSINGKKVVHPIDIIKDGCDECKTKLANSLSIDENVQRIWKSIKDNAPLWQAISNIYPNTNRDADTAKEATEYILNRLLRSDIEQCPKPKEVRSQLYDKIFESFR